MLSRSNSLFGRTIIVALFGLFVPRMSIAQDANPLRVWAAAGMGAGVPTSGGDGIANMAQLVFHKQPHHVAIRGLLLHDMESPTNSSATRTIGELGPLYGRTRMFDWGHAAVASGISGVILDPCPDDDDPCFTFGIPLVAEAAINTKFVGLGIQAFANFNGKATYAGAVLFLELGWLP
jgi:hypothetical protein